MPVILNSYFLKLRATANGIANSGSCIGSIILPIVYEHLLATYGLSGCFLLTGSIVLHLTIAGALMRPPPWLLKQARKNDKENAIVKYKSLPTSENLDTISAVSDSQKNHAKVCTKTNQTRSIEAKSSKPPCDAFARTEVKCLINQDENSQPEESISKDNNLTPGVYVEISPKTTSSKEPATNIRSSTILESFISVLTCPMFYVTAVTNVCFYFLYHMYVVIIVDYALDRKVFDVDAKNILFAFAISDLFGRLCLGWITDRKFITRPRFVMLCMLMIGIVFFAFPYATGYASLIVTSCLYGLLLGCTMVVFPILLVDFCGIELHAVAYGCMCFMNGFASFVRPFLIGKYNL